MSSAYSVSERTSPEIAILQALIERSRIQSTAVQNRAGARTQPYLTPDLISKAGEILAEPYPLVCSAIKIFDEI